MSIYPKEMKTGYQRDMCTLKLIVILFTIAKIWKQSRGPSVDGWMVGWMGGWIKKM